MRPPCDPKATPKPPTSLPSLYWLGLEADGGLAFQGGEVGVAWVVDVRGRAAGFGGDEAPAVGEAEAEEGLLGSVAGREVEVGEEFAVGEPGLHAQGDGAEGGGGALHFDFLAVLQPPFRGGEEETEGFGAAIVVEVAVLHEKVAQHGEEMGVGGAVGRAIEETAALVGGGERATFARDEGIGREALGQHAVEAHQRALGVVAAEGVQGVTGAVKGVDAGGAGPEGVAATGAEHAHAEAAMLLLVVGNPGLLGAAGGEDAAADDVADDDVPVGANAAGGDGVMNGF